MRVGLPARSGLLALGCGLGVAALLPAGQALAQGALASWTRPVVTRVELSLASQGDRARRVDPNRPIQLAAGGQARLSFDPYDQNGRRFPRDRFQVGIETARDCRGRLSIAETSSGDLELRGGGERGPCRVALWVPGNLNLEYQLTFEMVGLGPASYSRGQADLIVERLYRAVLQRGVDAPSRTAAALEIQAGRLEHQIRGMVGSAEFRAIRGRSSSAELLEAFYQGLFGRAPDARGARDYLAEIGRGRLVETLMNLIQSEEFERELLRVSDVRGGGRR